METDEASKITVYLWDVNETEVERLMEIFCDTLVERGYARDEMVRSIVTATGWEAPESPEDIIAEVGIGAAILMIPVEEEEIEG